MFPLTTSFKVFGGSREPRQPRHNINVHLNRLRSKLGTVEPGFDKIRVNSRDGLYWSRTRHESFGRGRVAVAKFIHEGYADGHAIILPPGEHAILCLLLKRDLVNAQMVQEIKQKYVFNPRVQPESPFRIPARGETFGVRTIRHGGL